MCSRLVLVDGLEPEEDPLATFQFVRRHGCLHQKPLVRFGVIQLGRKDVDHPSLA